MSFRKILVPVDGTDAAKSALQTAFRIGRDLAAHIEVLHVSGDPRFSIPLIGEGMSGAMVEELIELTEKEIETRATKARAMFDAARAEQDVPMSDRPTSTGPTAAWVKVVGQEDQTVVQRGRLSDLVVVGQRGAQSETPWAATINAALFETGRPVLVAPAEAPDAIGRRIAIAWNGSTEAARAVAAAMPLIARAEAVRILSTVSEETAEDGTPGLGDYLAWHGVTAEQRSVDRDDRPLGASMLEACSDADMLVMGAFTHSRLRQLILGGVTRYVLEQANLPLIMAH